MAIQKAKSVYWSQKLDMWLNLCSKLPSIHVIL